MAENTSLAVTAPAEAQNAFGENGDIGARAKSFWAQPAVKKSLPLAAGIGATALVAALYLAMAESPQRILYSSLDDAERAEVVTALDKGGISYKIDNNTGALTVGEDDVYKARMLVAGQGGLATPETTSDMLDAIPIGSSRTLEGERLRNVREQELTRTIMEIDAVEAVRVHLAQAERSVFVRDNTPPSASVMVRLARGRDLTEDQVKAIVNLVAGSVPGMSAEDVRVVDQHGQLLSDKKAGTGEGLELQREYEQKIRAQVSQLLEPLIGEGNYSTEVQVELDMEELTKARETYDKEGVVRTEATSNSTQAADPNNAGGVPGVLANTAPPPTTLAPAPQGATAPAGAAGATPGQNAEATAQRTFELGREVSVTSAIPGGVKRLTVAVALSSEALKKIKPATAAQIERLVSSAVGAQTTRGDVVTVMEGKFEPSGLEEAAFYETTWFATILRNVVALIAVVLAIFFGVKPLVQGLVGKKEKNEPALDANGNPVPEGTEGSGAAEGGANTGDGNGNEVGVDIELSEEANALNAEEGSDEPSEEELREQVELAKRLASQQPERATDALRRMLAEPDITPETPDEAEQELAA